MKARLTNIFTLIFLVFSSVSLIAQNKKESISFCNPLDLNYRFQLDEPSRREAADPTVVNFNGKYYMFASKSGGYWSSSNLVEWTFISTNDLPLEDYAPTAVVIDDAVYFMAMDKRIYRSTDPSTGKWEIIKENMPIRNPGDPCLFLDDDGRLYLFSGLSNFLPIYGVELDRKTFDPIGEQIECINTNKDDYGWERNGDYNTEKKRRPFVEGAWINKYNNKYYFQYAVPGTQFKSYADGYYTSNSPLGPFELGESNPFAYKPEGFICGAGHGSTFQDQWGNYWHAGTMTISVKHQFERRIGIFPAFFDKDGILYTYTGYGDFPHNIPQEKMKGPEGYQPKWMLLSYNKPIEVSSTLTGFPKENAANEEIRTYWSAETGNKGEWLMIDLQMSKTIGGIQINFAEEGSNILDRSEADYHQYFLEYSNDKKNWKVLVDKRAKKTNSHNYIELAKPVSARYIRLTNHHVPSGKFAVSGLRVFGKGSGKVPQPVSSFEAARDTEDGCKIALKWAKSSDAIGFNIRYGIHPEKLYNNYQVLASDSVSINSLNSSQKYYFTIDSFNENGISKSDIILER